MDHAKKEYNELIQDAFSNEGKNIRLLPIVKNALEEDIPEALVNHPPVCDVARWHGLLKRRSVNSIARMVVRAKIKQCTLERQMGNLF